MKKLIITFCFLAITVSLMSQNIEVSGQIQDEQNIEVPFANVVFKSTNDPSKLFGTLTDDKGNFTYTLPKDEYLLEVSVIGIEPKVVELNLNDVESNIDLGVVKISTDILLEEIVVKGIKSSYKINTDKKVYNVSKLTLVKGGSLTDVFQNIPSLQLDSDGQVSLRGDQNVRILIDGRPSGLTNTSELLSTIPANSIDKVEVVTNPSSKYSADGTAGVINVILKQDRKERFNSNIELFTGYRLTGGINGNISKTGESSSWYANAGIGYAEPKGINNIITQTPNEIVSLSKVRSNRKRNQLYYLVNTGLNKSLNKKNSLSSSITYRRANSNNENNTIGEDFNEGNLLKAYNRNELENEHSSFVQGNLSYNYKLSENGPQLSLDISGELTLDDENAVIKANETSPYILELSQDHTKNNEKSSRYIASFDCSYPFNNQNTVEVGYRFSYSNISNDISTERIINNNQFIIPEFTGTSNYNEKILAFYSQYSFSIRKLFLKLGLRAEISEMINTSINSEYENGRNFTNLFPSTFLNYDINEKNKLQFSITRRINRPRNWMIVPFSTFTDDRNIFIGNPDINPSYVNAFELRSTNNISSTIGLYPAIYYRDTTDEMEFYVEKKQLTIGNEVQDIFTSTIENVGKYFAYGAEIGLSYKPSESLDIFGELVFNGFKQRGMVRGASFNGDGVLISGKLNTNFNLFKSMKLQLQNYYRGPIETGQYKRKGFYGMNISLSNKIFKSNGTLTINITDVFNSNKRLITTTDADFLRDLELQFRVRQINLAITYRFNQKNYKGKKGNQYDNFEIIN